jgi:hypothetical protein
MSNRLFDLNVPDATFAVGGISINDLDGYPNPRVPSSARKPAETVGQEVAGYAAIKIGTAMPGFRGYGHDTQHLVVYTMSPEPNPSAQS